MKQALISALIKKGCKRWSKKGDRLYIPCHAYGLRISRYNTGNISRAELNGECIPNSRAAEMLAASPYIDLATEKLHIWGPRRTTIPMIEKAIDKMIADTGENIEGDHYDSSFIE